LILPLPVMTRFTAPVVGAVKLSRSHLKLIAVVSHSEDDAVYGVPKETDGMVVVDTSTKFVPSFELCHLKLAVPVIARGATVNVCGPAVDVEASVM